MIGKLLCPSFVHSSYICFSCSPVSPPFLTALIGFLFLQKHSTGIFRTLTKNNMGCFGRCLNSKVTKFILKLCFSHVGLCFIVLGYTVIGALIFKSIEGPDEVARYNKIVDAHNLVEQKRVSVRDQIILLAKQNVTDNPNQGKASVKKLLDQFHYVIYQALYNTSNQTNVTWAGYQLGYRGEEKIPDPSHRWSLPSAMLFTATILTTIGNFVKKPSLGCIEQKYEHLFQVTDTFIQLLKLATWFS